MSVFDREGMVDSGLTEPHGSALALLSDLHEQVELAITDCKDETLRAILINLAARIEATGLLVISGAKR